MCWQENCCLLSQQQESEGRCLSASRANTEQLQQVAHNLIYFP